jgi:hypothetical protein
LSQRLDEKAPWCTSLEFKVVLKGIDVSIFAIGVAQISDIDPEPLNS